MLCQKPHPQYIRLAEVHVALRGKQSTPLSMLCRRKRKDRVDRARRRVGRTQLMTMIL